eukprot:5981315-Prymnesium_polylepis.3
MAYEWCRIASSSHTFSTKTSRSGVRIALPASAHRSITARRRATVVLVASKMPQAQPRGAASSHARSSSSVPIAICSRWRAAPWFEASKNEAAVPASPATRRLSPALNSLTGQPKKLRYFTMAFDV